MEIISRVQLLRKLALTMDCMEDSQLAIIHNEIFIHKVAQAGRDADGITQFSVDKGEGSCKPTM